MLDLDANRVRPICTNVCNESYGTQTVALLAVALDKDVEHRLARRPFLSRIASGHVGLARCGDRDAVRKELAVLIEHLLREWQGDIQERVNVDLRLFRC